MLYSTNLLNITRETLKNKGSFHKQKKSKTGDGIFSFFRLMMNTLAVM